MEIILGKAAPIISNGAISLRPGLDFHSLFMLGSGRQIGFGSKEKIQNSRDLHGFLN